MKALVQKNVLYESLFLAAVTIVAASLRFYRLDAFPPGFHGDEAWTGLDALTILQKGYIGPYVGSALGVAAGHLYWTALVIKFLGASVFTVRLSMAILGALTVPVAYLLLRTMFGWRTAAIGAVLLTFSYWHLAFSRTGFTPISLPLVESITLLFVFLALKKGNLVYFLVAGVFFGASIYTYNTAPLFALAVVLFAAFIILLRRGHYALSTGKVFSFTGAAFLAASPMLLFIVQNPGMYFAHHSAVFFFQKGDFQAIQPFRDRLLFFLERFWHTVGLFFVSGGRDSVDGLGGIGLLDPLMGLALVFGVAISLRRIKDERYFLIVAGIITGLLGIALSQKGFGEYRRGISSLPFMVMGAAVGLEVGTGLVKRWIGEKASYIFLGLALLFVAGFNSGYYFLDFVKEDSTRWAYAYELTQAVTGIKQWDSKDNYVLFYSDRWSYNYETRKFILPNLRGEDRSERFGKLGIDKQPNVILDAPPQKVIYLILAPYDRLIDEIRQKYPGGEYIELREGNRFIYAAYCVQ